MASNTEEPTINRCINDTNNNNGASANDNNLDQELDHPHPADSTSNDYANDTTNNIILYPFAHQVGGHTQLLTLDKSTLCKPLIPRELLFYLNVPEELTKFVPSYKGVVQIRRTGQGGTYPPVVYQPLRSPKSPYASKCRPGSSCTLPAKLGPRYMSADICGFPFELKVQIRPCHDEKVLKKDLSQDNLLKADYISRPNEKYLLLLENVASKYQLPCILDLKMGTRQHGDDATEEKRHRQIAKCQASTSASLGVRLCGMQVYQVDYGGFLWYDKYCGRNMDQDGLKRALYEYFRYGEKLNEVIIDDVIQRLKHLSFAIENSPTFRFYGTSLLIIHDGCTTSHSNTKKCPVDVRLIDFAHTICDYSNTNTGRSNSSPSVLKSKSADQLSSLTNHSHTSAVDEKSSLGPDRGLLFGLKNLMKLLDDLKSETLIIPC